MTIDTYKTAREMLADLQAKKISARELLEAHLTRNDKLHKTLNAVIETDIPRAIKDAEAIDSARAKGAKLGALAGLPMTIKDGFDVENMPATAGAPGFRGRAKDCTDADVVAAARRAGAVIWGKTNVPYMLGDIQSYNEIYGTTNNPYDVTRTPGGSSGGAAAALAAGITPLEIGSDIGGSLRHPANFCGVVSLKPTWNVLSQRGHVPPAPEAYSENGDLNVVGPMARNVGDLRLLWDVMRGNASGPEKSVKGARIAIWDEDEYFPLADEVREGVARAADALSNHDVAIGNDKPPFGGRELMLPYLQTLSALLGSGLPDEVYDAFVAMREQDRKTLAEGGDGGASFRFFSTGSFRDVSRARAERQKQKDRLEAFFDDGYDAILMPVTPIVPFAHNHVGGFADRTIEVDGQTVPYGALINWISLATSLRAPAIAVQAGRTAAGLPVGVQLVGRWNGEDRLFDFAHALEQEFGFEPPLL